jgi:hypothetical protein
MRADGGGLRRLTRLNRLLAAPSWSPDGRTIVFAEQDAGIGTPLRALDVRSGRIRRVTPQSVMYTAPDWSPNGARIAFVKVTPCGGSCALTDVWVMRADGSDAHEVAKAAIHVSWSPDGSRLLLDSGTTDVVGADGSGRAHVTPETGAHDATPDWQPRCTRSGSGRGDSLLGGAGAELLCGLGGNDLIRGGPGRDRLFGGDDNDRIEARDGDFDVVGCGAGRDVVVADRGDLVGVDCERVSRASTASAASGGALST